MDSPKDTVLVTGVSGFFGSHVVDVLVAQGHKARGTARSAKVSRIQADYDSAYGSGVVKIFPIDDLAEDDYTSALEGVTAVIHLAFALPGRADRETQLTAAIEGTMNLLRQAEKLGVKKFGLISSVSVSFNPANPTAVVGEKDLPPLTKEIVLSIEDPIYIYAGAKVLMEQAVEAFGAEHPDINVIMLVPPFLIGPFAPAHRIQPGDTSAIATNLVIYNILVPDSVSKTPPIGFLDVRDAANALVKGIQLKGRHRILLAGEWFEFKNALRYIATVRPELESRLPDIKPTGQTNAIIDNTRAFEVLDLPPVTPWKEAVLDAVDAVIRIETEWIKKGVDVDSVLKQNEWRGFEAKARAAGH